MLYSPQKKEWNSLSINLSCSTSFINTTSRQRLPVTPMDLARFTNSPLGTRPTWTYWNGQRFLLKRGFSSNSNRKLKKWNQMKLCYCISIFLIYRLVCCSPVFWMVLKPTLRFLVVNAAGHLRDIQVLHPTGMNAAVESLQSSSELLPCQNQRTRESFKTDSMVNPSDDDTVNELRNFTGSHPNLHRDHWQLRWALHPGRGARSSGRGWRRWGGWSQGRRGWRWGRGWLLH